MKFARLFGYYVAWHYGPAFLDIWGIYKNFLWFLYNFFSIPTLLKTLFSSLKRLHEAYSKDFEPAELFAAFAVNILMRILGAILRLFVIIIGTLSLIFSVFLLVFFFFGWILLPFAVSLLFLFGFSLIFF